MPRSGEPNRGLENLGKTLSERKVLKAAEPPKECRRKAEKGFNWIVRGCLLCALIRGLENLEAFPERETGLFFSRVRKEPKVHQRFANLWTPGTIQIAGRYMIVVEVTGIHQVTGRAGNRKVSGYRR